jgi:hypothetical protein
MEHKFKPGKRYNASYDVLQLIAEHPNGFELMGKNDATYNLKNRVRFLYRAYNKDAPETRSTRYLENLYNAVSQLQKSLKKVPKVRRNSQDYQKMVARTEKLACAVERDCASRAKAIELKLRKTLTQKLAQTADKIAQNTFSYQGKEVQELYAISNTAEKIGFENMVKGVDYLIEIAGRQRGKAPETQPVYAKKETSREITPSLPEKIRSYFNSIAQTLTRRSVATTAAGALALAGCLAENPQSAYKKPAPEKQASQPVSAREIASARGTTFTVHDGQDQKKPEAEEKQDKQPVPPQPQPQPEPQPKPEPTPVPQPQPQPQPQPEPKPQEEISQSYTNPTIILRGKGFFGNNTNLDFRQRAIVPFSNSLRLVVDAQESFTNQEFSNGGLEGEIYRAGIGLDTYFKVGDQGNQYLYAMVQALYENRTFDFENNFKFGNDAIHALIKLGYVNVGDFNDEIQLFDKSRTKLLLTYAHGEGEMNGDIKGPYRSDRITLDGLFKVSDSWGIQAGVGLQEETFGNKIKGINRDWTQRIASVEAGLFNDFSLFDSPARIKLSGTGRYLESIIDDNKTTSQHPGVHFQLAVKPSRWIQLALDAGYEFPDGKIEGNGAYGGVSATILLGGNDKKNK